MNVPEVIESLRASSNGGRMVMAEVTMPAMCEVFGVRAYVRSHAVRATRLPLAAVTSQLTWEVIDKFDERASDHNTVVLNVVT